MFTAEIFGNRLQFETVPSLFSPSGPDRGTLAMLSRVRIKPDDIVLDLGCGYGLVGIAIAREIGLERVCMIDINPLAVEMARRNAVLNGFEDVTVICGDGPDATGRRDFTAILSNPPYHTDFSVARRFIEQGYRSLAVGGRMIMVVKRLDWYRNKMASVFGGVRVDVIDGYFVLESEKRALSAEPKKAPKPTTRKHLKRMEKARSR